MSLEILDVSKQEMNKLRNNNSSKENYPDYLFNICREELRWREDRSLASCTTGGVAVALSPNRRL